VAEIAKRAGVKRVNVLGVCEGGVFATAFAALEPERINTLTLTITPIDFHADMVEEHLGHGFINVWTRSISAEDVDRLFDANGNLPGEFMAAIFNQMSPLRSLLKYNLDLLDIVDDEQRLMNWLRMEKWIADRPDHPGEAARQWLKDLYQQNKLVQNEWELDGRRVDLGNIRMPVLNVYAKDDHIIPPATSRALGPNIGRSDPRGRRRCAVGRRRAEARHDLSGATCEHGDAPRHNRVSLQQSNNRRVPLERNAARVLILLCHIQRLVFTQYFCIIAEHC
jgi:polyhydroxyalkanoate synthase